MGRLTIMAGSEQAQPCRSRVRIIRTIPRISDAGRYWLMMQRLERSGS